MNENPTDADEQFELAKNYVTGGDREKALYWFTKAAEQSHTEAQYIIGTSYGTYDNIFGIQKDPEKAVYWSTKAAEQGHAGAQFYLGLIYATGDGVPKDWEEAEYWVTKAAEQGNEDAERMLAQLDSL